MVKLPSGSSARWRAHHQPSARRLPALRAGELRPRQPAAAQAHHAGRRDAARWQPAPGRKGPILPLLRPPAAAPKV